MKTLKIWPTKNGGHHALFVSCQTSGLQQFRDIYLDTFGCHGNKAVILSEDVDAKVVVPEHFKQLALTNQLWK